MAWVGIAIGSFGILLSRPILQDGALHLPWAETIQFNYPFTVVLVQLGLTFVLLTVARPLFVRGVLGTFLDFASSHHCRKFQTNSIFDDGLVIENPSSLSLQKHSRAKLLLLAILIAADATLGAQLLFHSPVEIYVLSRGIVIPLFWLVENLMQKTKWPPTLAETGVTWSSTILSTGAILASCRPGLLQSSHVFGTTVLSSLITVLCTLQIEQIFRRPPLKEQYQLIGTSNTELQSSNNASLTSHIYTTTSVASNIASNLKLFSQVSFQAALALAPLVIFWGEIGHIFRNCYFLDEPVFWWQLFLGGLFRFILLTSTILFIQATSAHTSIFWSVFVHILLLPLFKSSTLVSWQIAGYATCIIAGLFFCNKNWTSFPEHADASRESDRLNRGQMQGRSIKILYRCFMGVIIVLFCIGSIGYLLNGKKHKGSSNFLPIIQGKEGYLGDRPNSKMQVNFTQMVKHCRGTHQNLEHISNYHQCLEYLSSKQADYLYLPDSGTDLKSSESSNKATGVLGAMGCDGPIIPFHVWWSGTPSWRIELFIKSYLFTQNLACSQLWIWVNTDQEKGALRKWVSNRRFQKFQTLIDRGDILLSEWKLPSRVPLSSAIYGLDMDRYYQSPGSPNAKGETKVAESVIRDASGQEWLQLYENSHQITYFTVAASDAARIIILYLHGGVYIDIDMILLRDLRPLLLPQVPFAERWGINEWYNNALVALPANSSMASYLLRGGARMGLVYHFKALSRMLRYEGMDDRNENGLVKLENAFFDPAGAERREGDVKEYQCTVPCLPDFGSVFRAEMAVGEWASFGGERVAEDGVNNRTMENFFPGAWAYHIHNQWHAEYEPGSWMDVICTSHDRFFTREGNNPYSEEWTGPFIDRYGSLS